MEEMISKGAEWVIVSEIEQEIKEKIFINRNSFKIKLSDDCQVFHSMVNFCAGSIKGNNSSRKALA